MDDAKRAYVLALYAAGRSSFEIAVETALPQAEVFRVLLDNAAPRCTEEPRFDRYEPAAWVRQGMARSRQIEQLTERIAATRKAFRDQVSYAITAGGITEQERQQINRTLMTLWITLDDLHHQRDKLAFGNQKEEFRLAARGRQRPPLLGKAAP
jgi:hypothetical protein